MASEATRGSKLVAITALVVAAILAYYYWTETNISRELFERMEKMHAELIGLNQTVKDYQVTIEAQKEQLGKVEEENKKKIEEEKKKLEVEKKALEAKAKEATDNAQKLTNEKTAVELRLSQSQTDCSKSCEDRVNKAVEECKHATTGSAKGFLW